MRTKKVKRIKLLKGENVAVVSDAGTPGISDPGEEIIKKAIENNIRVIPIPGACAAINALICSGFSTKEFLFIGFLSAKKSEKIAKLEGQVQELKEKLEVLDKLEYDKKYSRSHVKEVMKEVVPTYKDPKEINEQEVKK